MEVVFAYSQVWSLKTIQRTSVKFYIDLFNTERFQELFILVHNGKNQYYEHSAGTAFVTRMYSPEQIKIYNS